MSEVQLTIEGQSKQPSGFRLAATLGVAGLLSGFLLSLAFQVTKPIIDANRVRELREGVLKVVPGSTQVQKLALRDGSLVPIPEEEKTADSVIYGAYDDTGDFRGYGIVNAGPGFQDEIRLLYGYDPATRHIVGLHILQSRETPGLGDKIFKDPKFGANFDDLAVEPNVVVVKTGRLHDNEVDAITGATISSKSVVRIINQANAFWLEKLPPAGSEPARTVASGEGGAP